MTEEERRWKRMMVDPRLMGEMFFGLAEIVETTLPPDAECVLVDWDVNRQMFHFVYEHPSFEPVPFGDIIPDLDLPVWRRKDDNPPAYDAELISLIIKWRSRPEGQTMEEFLIDRLMPLEEKE